MSDDAPRTPSHVQTNSDSDLPPPPPPPLDDSHHEEEEDGLVVDVHDGREALSAVTPDPLTPPPPAPPSPPPSAPHSPMSMPTAPSSPPLSPPAAPSSPSTERLSPALLPVPEHARMPSSSAPLTLSPSLASHTTNRSVGSSMAAMVSHASLLSQTLSASIPEYDSDSDDDLPPSHRPLTTPRSALVKKWATMGAAANITPHRWEVEKANRYGLKDSRVVVLDLAGHAVQFFEREKLKSEVPLNQIAACARRPSGDEPKRVEMQFKQNLRPYELYFKTESDAADFARLVSCELDSHTRPYSQSVYRNAAVPPSPSSMPVPPSPAVHHSHHNSTSSIGSIGGGHMRDASDSIAIHSEVDQVNVPSDTIFLTEEDHNAYLDYTVIKRNRYGLRQPRILVINSTHRTILLLDEKRKFKKDFSLSLILGVDIPKAKDKAALEAECYLSFAKESGQKPFHLFFADTLDRLHFCERLSSLAPHPLVIKDESDQRDDDDTYRFGILKLNKVGVKKKRIVVLRTAERVLRSCNHEKSHKDTRFDTIIRWEKPLADRFRLNLFIKNRPQPLIFIFPDPVAREQFVVQSNYIRQLMAEEAMAAAALSATPLTTAATPAAPASALTSSLHAPLSIFIGSWNLGNAPFTYESLNDFIPSMKYDLYVIGLQECSKGHRDQWLLELRNHIQQNWKSSTSGSVTTSVEDDKDLEQPYTLLGVVKLWEIVMMVLIRRPLAVHVSNLCMDTIATGVGDVLGNKGGCGISFAYQESNLCFVACHLAARSERVVQRAENYMKILKQLQLGLPDIDILSQNDHVFWLGDLNYRTELEFAEVLQLVKMKDWRVLAQSDQLLSQMSKQLVLAGFQEAPLRFAPTYRWERKENVFSNKKFQAPSWTDRVLWHSLPGLADLKLEQYSSAPNVMGSDHRPVFATFTLASRPAYTGRLDPRRPHPPIRILHNENTNLHSPSNAAFAPAPTAATRQTMPLIGTVAAPTPDIAETTVVSSLPSSDSSRLLSSSASPASTTPYHHFTLPSKSTPASLASLSETPVVPVTAALGSGSFPTPSKTGFTPYLFKTPPPGPLFTPPTPTALMASERAPLLGSTRNFTIVLQSVKCTFSNMPRGDFTITTSAPFLQAWPTTSAVSYQFGLEVGCHWEELTLTPFIHDLYYLYTRHLLLSISVPSIAANTSGQNVEQTGVGTCIGTVTVGLGSVCAKIFNLVAHADADAAKPTHQSQKSGVGVALTGAPFVLAPHSPTPKPTNPNRPSITGDNGGYYFIEPIYREGLYAGQLEGRISFRYK